MALRVAAPGLAAVALVASLGGAGSFVTWALLAAIVAGAARLIEAVGEAAERRSERLAVVTAGAGVIWLVAAGATHVQLFVLGLFVCVAIELVGAPAASRHAVAEAAELLEAPVSRAA